MTPPTVRSVDDPGREPGQTDRVGGGETSLARCDFNLLLGRGDPRYRREQQPGASTRALNDHAVARRIELISGVDRLSCIEEIHGHIESVDFARLQRREAGVRDRRSDGRAGNLAAYRWFTRLDRADAAAERAFHLAGCGGFMERDEDAARRRVTRQRWRMSDLARGEVVADRGPGHADVLILLGHHPANVDADGLAVKGRKSMDATARAAYRECSLLRSTMRPTVRPPAVAGAFYPADPVRLAADVRGYLAGAPPVDLDFLPRILIVPHAGYVYSGAVAATGYQLLEAMDHIRRIVMFGPSHYVWFTGLALPEAELLETPLGAVAVDEDAAAQVAGNPLVTKSTEAHEREHSLEVQLPFLQVVAAEIPVVPFLTGDIHPVGAADAVESILDHETLLLVSSDLSHYHDSTTARRLDAETAASIERLDPGALTRESACGRTGVQAALYLAKRSGYRVQLLDLRNSSDTAGPPDRVVGYGTFAIGA